MSDQIIIHGLRLNTKIGVPEEERANFQEVRAHLTLTVPTFPLSDDISGTVDYKQVGDCVRELAGRGERKLLETLAQEIASKVLVNYPVEGVKVELEKRILPETDWVGVVIERGN